MIGYSQTEQGPHQVNQTSRQQDELDLHRDLQRLERVQQASGLGEGEGEGEETTENATGPTENASEVFSYATEVPSLKDLRKIQIETPPGSTLRDKLIGPSALGTPFEDAIGNSTSNGNLTSLQNATVFANMTSLANFTPAGNLTATINARNPTTTEQVSDRAGAWSGCRTGYLDRVNPEWVPVRPTPDSQPWTEPVTVEGTMTPSRVLVNYIEFPFTHNSHDRTFHFDPDPAYVNLDSTRPGNIETEWEIGYTNTGVTDKFPKEFWPWEGDRVWMMGWWVIDCGHFKQRVIGTDPTGEPIFETYDYKTEIHPPFFTAFTRNEPYLFLGDDKPSSAAVTYIYLHGRGGTHDTPVGGQNYEFDIKMPPCVGSFITCQFPEVVYNVKSLPFGGPEPILSAEGNKVHVVIPLSDIPASPDLRYGAIVAAKWGKPTLAPPTEALPTPIESSRTLRVTFDSIRVFKDHDIGEAEWKNLWVGVNGRWIELLGPNGVFEDVDDDDGHGETFYFPAGSKSVTVIVPENGQLKIKSTGWESDHDSCYSTSEIPSGCDPVDLVHINNPIGYVERVTDCSEEFDLVHPQLGAGSHPIKNGDDETDEDYALSYRIEQLSRVVGTVGNCSGPAPVAVPDVVCGPIGTAATIIQQAGLVPKYSQTGGPIVVNQLPQSGTVVAYGSNVSLTRGSLCP